jgi:hypothetical protein
VHLTFQESLVKSYVESFSSTRTRYGPVAPLQI